MSTFATNSTGAGALRNWFNAVGQSLMNSMVAYGEKQCRREEFEALEKLSDAQLAKMGLTRDTIAMHVFRDKLFM